MKDRRFKDSARKNNRTFNRYFERLQELAISMFEWKNLPDTVDPRFLELTLFGDGMAIFFYDEVLGYLALKTMIGGRLNVYQIPVERTAYASNGYNVKLSDEDSVIIFNNMIHTNSIRDINSFAERLYNIDRIIDVNANAQKTPILVSCDEQQRLTLKNLYMQYDGNMPVIYGDKNINPNSLKVLTTGAPYVCDKLYTLKTQYWNEALTFLGVSNLNISKRERLLVDEVTRNQGATVASRYSRLEARQQACKQINQLFGLNIWCEYKQDFEIISDDEQTEAGDMNE